MGVSICLDVVSIETLDLRRQKSISLDVMDNLDGFQKLVSIEIKISQFSLDEVSQDRTF